MGCREVICVHVKVTDYRGCVAAGAIRGVGQDAPGSGASDGEGSAVKRGVHAWPPGEPLRGVLAFFGAALGRHLSSGLGPARRHPLKGGGAGSCTGQEFLKNKKK